MKAKHYSPQGVGNLVLKRLLAPLHELRGVQRVVVFESDGFVLYEHGGPSEINHEPLHVFQALLHEGDTSAAVTMVQQGGYVLLQQVNIGILLVAAERTCNLGAVRKTLSEVRKALE